MARLTATVVARSFSDILNRVAAGEEIEITRNGAIVAVLAGPRTRFLPAERLHALVSGGPAPDGDFARDVRAATVELENAPEQDPWRPS